LFVDGAVEPKHPGSNELVASIGGVALDPGTRSFQWFGATVPESVVSAWQSSGSKQVIAQAEILPVLVARVLFAATFAGRSTLCFVDNDSARHALVAASSPNPWSAKLVEAIVDCDLADGALLWYERVPSASNVADAPSRGKWPEQLPGWQWPPARAQVDWTELPRFW